MSYKLFVDSNGVVYNGAGNQVSASWSSLSDTQKETLFLNSGSTDTSFSGLSSLGTVKCYTYSTFSEATHTCSLDVVPYDQTVLPHGLIDLSSYTALKSVNIVYSLSGSGAVKIAVTPDLTNYYVFNTSTNTWETINISNLNSNGMNVSQISSIGDWSIFDEAKKIGFAYGLSIDSINDTCKVDRLDITVDANGSWAKATESQATYKYQGNTTLVVSLMANGDYKINYQS